jgi:hypothetical protein
MKTTNATDCYVAEGSLSASVRFSLFVVCGRSVRFLYQCPLVSPSSWWSPPHRLLNISYNQNLLICTVAHSLSLDAARNSWVLAENSNALLGLPPTTAIFYYYQSALCDHR